jgi:hypothetical protein
LRYCGVMHMPTTRCRRIARRALMALAVVVLLLASSVSSWFCLHWLKGRGTISAPASKTLTQTVFVPVIGCIGGELPRHEFLWRATLWCRFRGSGANIP